jgi:hypothetical protein
MEGMWLWRLGRRGEKMGRGKTRFGGRMRSFLEARRAAERRLLPRPFRQAMERRLRALAMNERS